MSDRRKDFTSADQEKIQQHQEFLDKYIIRQHMKDALLKLIENRPANPMLFLANYFDSISINDQADRISKAANTLQLSHFSCPAFQSNLMVAYDILSAPKNPNSKKLANKRSGLSGSVHEELINFICKDIAKELLETLLSKVSCRWNEMVPFDVFRYSITVSYVLQDFLKLSEDLYIALSGRKENAADKYLCEAAVNAFKEALYQDGTPGNIPRALEVGRKLRPDSLASVMLQAKEDEGDAKEITELDEFVSEMANVYLDNVKCIR